MQAVIVPTSSLPNADTEIFHSSTFFRQGTAPRRLPTPAEVRAQGERQNRTPFNASRPPPAVFPCLNLLVKYGEIVSISEGQCLWMIRNYLGDKVPVPEVYGWIREGSETFIYMELIQGSTLEQKWKDLSAAERSSLCDQLRPMIEALQTLKRGPVEKTVGSVASGPLQDIMFESLTVGPFVNVSMFHDFFSQPRWIPNGSASSSAYIDPLRADLPDDDPIAFVHGDLHRSNIMIASEGPDPPRILAIVDWHQSGWYPAYWEYSKARRTAWPGEEWETMYIPRFLQPRAKAYHSFNWFCHIHGQ